MFRLFFVVSMPLLVYLLPIDFWDRGAVQLCWVKRNLGVDCPTCGLTRACIHLLHLDIDTALSFHRASFIIVPVLVLLWLFVLFSLFRGMRKNTLTES